MNVFKGKESLYLTPLQNNGTFAIYERGLKTTKKVTKITDLPTGQHMIYIGGENPLVNEPHPTEESGCFPIKNARTE